MPSCGPNDLTERFYDIGLHLLPRQSIKAPAAVGASVKGRVQLALKTVQDIGDVGKARRL